MVAFDYSHQYCVKLFPSATDGHRFTQMKTRPEYLEASALPQIFKVKLAIPQYLCKQTSSNCFSTMNRHYRAPAIRMLQEVVAPFDTNHQEPMSLEGFYNLVACN